MIKIVRFLLFRASEVTGDAEDGPILWDAGFKWDCRTARCPQSFGEIVD